jgi:plasmid stability protein
MADILVRDIDQRLKRKIEQRARANRQSLSDEVKTLIRKGLVDDQQERKVGTVLSALVPRQHRGDDLVFERSGTVRRPPDLE